MKHTVTKWEFIDSIMRINDNAKNGTFTTEALEILWDWYDDIEYGDMEFYPSDISGAWSQYKNLKEFQNDYTDEYEDLDDIRDRSIVLQIDDESFLVNTEF